MFASGLYDKSGPHNASRSDPNSSKLSPGHLPEPKEPKPQQDSGEWVKTRVYFWFHVKFLGVISGFLEQ